MIAGTCTHTSPFILVDRIGRKSALSTSTVRKPISAGRSFHKPLTHAGLLRNSDQGGTGVLEESAVCAPLEGTPSCRPGQNRGSSSTTPLQGRALSHTSNFEVLLQGRKKHPTIQYATLR